MTVLSRVLLRKLIIQEMRKPPLSSGLSFDDDTIEIDRDTDIEEFPEPEYGDFGDFDDDDYDDDDLVMGSDLDLDDDDTEEESETEDREGSYPDYAVFGPDDETEAQIRQKVNKKAEEMMARINSYDPRSEANARYADLMKQIQQSDRSDTEAMNIEDPPPDPEFMDTDELPPSDLKENIRRSIRQLINQRMTLL